jgi:hypothetical protein
MCYPRHLTTLQAYTPFYRDSFTFDFTYLKDCHCTFKFLTPTLKVLGLSFLKSVSYNVITAKTICYPRHGSGGSYSLLCTYTAGGLRKGISHWRRASAKQKLINKFKRIFYWYVWWWRARVPLLLNVLRAVLLEISEKGRWNNVHLLRVEALLLTAITLLHVSYPNVSIFVVVYGWDGRGM